MGGKNSGRTKNAKNKIPSKESLVDLSVETIKATMDFVTLLIRNNQLSELQKGQITEIYKQMAKVVEGSNKHYRNRDEIKRRRERK